jgi:transcription-repair coupling factor (superfamily II helicase)
MLKMKIYMMIDVDKIESIYFDISKDDRFSSIMSQILLFLNDKIVIICSNNPIAFTKLNFFLHNKGISLVHKEKLSDVIESKDKGVVYFADVNIDTSYSYGNICFISDKDIFGRAISVSKNIRYNMNEFVRINQNFNVNDIVVHKSYGVGRFLGIESISVDKDVIHDCIKIEYARGNRLMVPVENIDMLYKYKDPSDDIELDTLRSSGWKNKTNAVKKYIKDIAEKLIQIEAKNKSINGFVFASSELYDDFVKAFPYVETQDQINAINDIQKDISSGEVMNRLICGDVGFGKTEVAMRAVFMAVMNGFQVAVLCPTTILAKQHYDTFIKRFEGFGLNIACMSRLQSQKEMKGIKANIASGNVNIAIGTHALLSGGIKFNKLGLCVIDEEQLFGVEQKEHLRKENNGVHILSMSATPIPRTMQMALSGIRDVSIISTPPFNRLAVKTNIMVYDIKTIIEIIENELSRGGGVYIITHFISDIHQLESDILAKKPNLKMKIAHGQMPSNELEDVIIGVYEKKFDVLLSTTIIASGIDIKHFNTVIINNAHDFGMSQLHQIRGRVGRGSVQGYCYMMLRNSNILENAEIMKKLRAIESNSHLGSGFAIATSDMDIRGSGNLLGVKQSGKAESIGVELYYDMLNEEVERMKKTSSASSDVEVEVSVSVQIPKNYIKDYDDRIHYYRSITMSKCNDEIDALVEIIYDKFGTIPESIMNLVKIKKIKLFCGRYNIRKINIGHNDVKIDFIDDKFINVDYIIELISNGSSQIKINDLTLIFAGQFINSDRIMHDLLISELSKYLIKA